MLSQTCSICAQLSDTKYLESYFDQGQEYKLYECGKCRAQYWLPLQNPGSLWYESDERYAGANKAPTMTPNWNHRKVIAFLKPLAGKVLDIGCGTGNFLAWAKKSGWEVFGIDFDRNAVKAAQDFFALPNIEVSSLKAFRDKEVSRGSKFDLVTFFDVFEHIDNHSEFIEMVRELLADEGYVAMSMPYRGGARWLQPHDYPPRHLTRWNRESLTNFLLTHHLEPIYVKRAPATLNYVVLKMRFKYGKALSFGTINKIEKKNNGAHASEYSLKIKLMKFIARIKDYIFFGLPAFFIWLYLILTGRIYITLFVIARKI